MARWRTGPDAHGMSTSPIAARRAAEAADAALPARESPRRRALIRSVAVAALAMSVAYLAWRGLFTLDASAAWLSVPLYIVEIHAAFGLFLFTVSLWDLDVRPAIAPTLVTRHRVAVLIPTYNEGREILLPTVAAALAMRVEHETWVLDDGNRPDVQRMAEELGARYLARRTHEHAKAGNLNHALGIIDADLVAVLDADHVSHPDFLVRTLGYFDDPRIALVQTPQDFYNRSSFEHQVEDREDGRFHEQVLFYRAIQPGKNRWGAAFWCGTGAIVRTAALRDVGGVATDSITEDIETTIRLHRRGWKTIYHNEVLAHGLAAADADTYQAQRLRWGTGAMQVLRRDHPITGPGLSIGQRLGYAATLFGWFDAWRSLGYLLLPPAVLLTGIVPIRADALTFGIFFGSTFIAQQVALLLLSRGRHRPILAVAFEMVRMTPNLRSTLTLLTRRRPGFMVTPKGRTGDGRHRARAPRLLVGVLGLNLVATLWYVATLLGRTPTAYPVPWAVHMSFAWLIVNVGFLCIALARIRTMRFAPERRSSVRFEAAYAGSIDEQPAEVRDLSLTGARLLVAAGPGVPAEVAVGIEVADQVLTLRALVRSVRRRPDGRLDVGLEFADGQDRERARLAPALFRTHVLPAGEEDTDTTARVAA
jgi:cellulose synthase (UDP-forming)